MKIDEEINNKSKFFLLNRRQFFFMSGMLGIALLSGERKISIAKTGEEAEMTYTVKDYNRILGMEGFSDPLLKNHFTLYQGYVTQSNKIMEALNLLLKEGKAGTPEYAELKRRFGWEFNGMRLHEYYFENLGGKGISKRGGNCIKNWLSHLVALRHGRRILRQPAP